MDRTEAIRAIRDAADIHALVAERVKLRKSGTGWMGGPCPLHGGGARTPCVSVLPDKGTWHCFSCGEGGDAFDWMQKVHGLTFEEALEDLAHRTGVALPEKEQKQPDGPEARILRAIALAQDFYVQSLRQNGPAMDYLLGRGLTRATIEEEGLGYAPGSWDATLGFLSRSGVRAEIAEQAGIAVRSQRGTLIDFLRDRITIPIRDPRGRIIAFGGRAMPGAPADSPKYMNTRETPVFRKSETVFHLHRARTGLREEGAVVCEGYFDVLTMAQQGVTTAVAPLGTALTEGHLKALRRWTTRVTLAFDGDPAGWNATEKAIHLALPAGFDVRLLHIPDGDDPDTWALAQGSKAREAVRKAPDWASFALEKAKEGRDMRRIEDRLAAAREVAEWIAYLPQERQQEVRVAAAHELHISTEQIRPTKPQERRPEEERRKPPRHELPPMDEAIESLVGMAAQSPAHLRWVQALPRGWWDWRQGAAVLENVMEAEGDIESMGDATAAAVRGALAKAGTVAQTDPRRLQTRLEKEFLTREIQDMTRKIAANIGDVQFAAMLQSELTELRARMARLARGGK